MYLPTSSVFLHVVGLAGVLLVSDQASPGEVLLDDLYHSPCAGWLPCLSSPTSMSPSVTLACKDAPTWNCINFGSPPWFQPNAGVAVPSGSTVQVTFPALVHVGYLDGHLVVAESSIRQPSPRPRCRPLYHVVRIGLVV